VASRPLTVFSLDTEQIETALLTGEYDGLLQDYFGAEQYATLRHLAQEAKTRSVRGGPRVLILPGIMGSTLGLPDDLIWLDPLDVLRGNLRKLNLKTGVSGIVARGVFLLAYEKLKLRLQIAGFDADFQPFDWRLSISTLGKQLAKRIDDESGPVHLVAHSMGGLVARACLAAKPKKIGRVVTLGTPNFGSFAPLQAFRGVHSVVRKLAWLDLSGSQEDLAQIFKTFPGLCEMFPADFFSLAAWPSGGVLPDQSMLTASRKEQQALPLPGNQPDWVQIVGCNKETVVGATIQGDKFEYTSTNEGDGTVPLALARLPDKVTYYVEESHGSLPNNGLVERAVSNILATGKTDVLPTTPIAVRSERVRTERERDLGADIDGDGHKAAARRAAPSFPSAREARHMLEEFASPTGTMGEETGVPVSLARSADGLAAMQAISDRIVVARRRQTRLELSIAHGNLIDMDANAYVLGVFSEVSPSGPAAAVDEVLDGALALMLERRMFSPNLGEVFILPKGRHPIRADFVALAGLGTFDTFKPETLEVVGENLARTFIATRVDDFATVPIGGGTGNYSIATLRSFLAGFLRGVVDADHSEYFRGFTICEIDDHRYIQLRDALFQLSRTRLFDGVEVTLRELPPPVTRTIVSRATAPVGAIAQPQPVYLIVRQEDDDLPEDKEVKLTASLLTAGEKATIVKDGVTVAKAKLDAMLKKIVADQPTAQALPALGKELGTLVLPASVNQLLSNFIDRHLVIVHDAGASRIPWDTIHIGEVSPALGAGLSHRYEAPNLAVAKWLQKRQQGKTLSVLLVVNPTEDLPGAAKEGKRIKELFGALPSSQLHVLTGPEAQRDVLLRCFSSGQYDVVHYSGHAFFDEMNPERSGILCAGRDVLSGRDLATLSDLPCLVFFNACEAARIRRFDPDPDPVPIPVRLRRGVGFAEAFLRGGIANYVGTYWPVNDDAAEQFANAFYKKVLEGRTLGDAMLDGRKEVKNAGSVDWADYILYGDPNFILKRAT